jgi:hypothetical protein
MFGKRIAIHSNSFHKIPNDISFPIMNYSGFHQFDFSESHLIQFFQQYSKEYGLSSFNEFVESNINHDDISTLARILNKFASNSLLQDNASIRSPLNSLFADTKYVFLNDIDFTRSLDTHWSLLLSFLYKMESKYLVIGVPKVQSSPNLSDAPFPYQEKYIKKIETRFKTIAKLAAKNEIRVLIDYDPLPFYVSSIKEKSKVQTPFSTFGKFRSFYDDLIADEENLGLYLDVSEYFLLKSSEIIQYLAQIISTDEKIKSLSAPQLDEFLLKSGHSTDTLFNDIHNIERLYIIGLNDCDLLQRWLKILSDVPINQKQISIQSIEKNLPRIHEKIINILKDESFLNPFLKRYFGLGDLPLRTFFTQLRSHHSQMTSNQCYSMNQTLQIDEFNLDSIDWRSLDLTKISFNQENLPRIQQYIKNKLGVNNLQDHEEISAWKKHELNMALNESESNINVNDKLSPKKELIENLYMMSIKTIRDSIQKYISFL